MERNTTRLYEVLSVSKTATQAEIKRAYRSLALQHHPDRHSGENRAGGTASRARFQEIAEAYEVLSDPRKRRIYDNHGMSGVRLEGSPVGSWLLFGTEQIICFLSTFLSLIMALGIYFFITLSLRVDHRINWNYAVVFIPVWIFDVLGYLGFLGELVLLSPFKDDEDPDTQEGFGGAPGSTEDERAAPATPRKRTKWRRIMNYASRLLVQVLQTAFYILVVIKANDPSSLPATVVFAPFLAMRLIEAITKAVVLATVLKMSEGTGIDLLANVLVSINMFWIDLILLSLTILTMLRIDGYITWSWFWVLSPVGLVAFKSVVGLLWRRLVISRTQASEERRQAQSKFTADVVSFVVLSVVGYSFVGLLAAKLDGHAISALVIAAPFLVILALGLCTTACCLPFAAYAARSSPEDGLGSGPIRV
ncbi:unnamed protein product [Mortierella alpina]